MYRGDEFDGGVGVKGDSGVAGDGVGGPGVAGDGVGGPEVVVDGVGGAGVGLDGEVLGFVVVSSGEDGQESTKTITPRINM